MDSDEDIQYILKTHPNPKILTVAHQHSTDPQGFKKQNKNQHTVEVQYTCRPNLNEGLNEMIISQGKISNFPFHYGPFQALVMTWFKDWLETAREPPLWMKSSNADHHLTRLPPGSCFRQLTIPTTPL